MARLIARANGNFTDSNTWGVVDTTSLLDSEAYYTALTTSYTESASFTPGAITIDGIAVKVNGRAASPSGTMSVRLAQAGSTVPGTEVTINVSDLPPITAGTGIKDIGWVFFKFASPVTLQAATAYTVSAKTSVSSQVWLYRDGTTNNWSRMLRTTTTQAPALGDGLYINGEWTGAGSVTTRAVTMDDESGTVYGWLEIGGYGKLQFSTDSGKALKLYIDNQDSHIRYGGELNIGTSSNPVPRSSTAVMGTNSPAAARGLYCWKGSVVTAYGQSRTSGKEAMSCLLTQNASAGQTTVYVDTDTGWKAGDEVVLNSNVKGTSQIEIKTLQSDAGSGSLTFTTGLSYARYVTGYHKTEVLLLTQNVSLVSNTSSKWSIYTYSSFSASFVLGKNFRIYQYAGDVSITKCSFRSYIIYTSNDATTSTFTITDCVGYYQEGSSISQGAVTIDGYVVIYAYGSITLDGIHGYSSYKNLRFYNTGSSFFNLHGSPYSPQAENIECRYSGQRACYITLNYDETLTVKGLLIYQAGSSNYPVLNFSGEGTFYGENISIIAPAYYAIELGGINQYLYGKIRNLLVKTESGSTCTRLFNATGTTQLNLSIKGLTVDESGGAITEHFYSSTYYKVFVHIEDETGFDETKLNISSVRWKDEFAIAIDNTDEHLLITPFGMIKSDSTIRRGDTGFSQRLIPSSSSLKLKSGLKRVPVNSGGQVAINVYVRESVSGDGQDYDGSRPRLILKENYIAGITEDTVLDTATSACEGAWEQLSGISPQVDCDTILEFYIDCDGTQGWVSVDDWSVG